MKVKTTDYIPGEIVPRYGTLKRKLQIEEEGSHYVLNAKKCRKEIRISKVINLTKEDLIAIGLYLAEGKKEHWHENKSSNHSGEISFDCSSPKALNLFCGLIEKFGVKKEELRSNLDININYKEHLTEKELLRYWVKTININPRTKRKKWMRYMGVKGGRLTTNTSPYGCIKLAYASVILRNIFIPFVENFFKRMVSAKNKEAISFILMGYFLGDGHVSYFNKHKRINIEFLCNDKELRGLLKEALYILGMNNIKETDPEHTKTHTHALRIYNYPDSLILKQYGIPDLMDYKKERFDKVMAQYSGLQRQ